MKSLIQRVESAKVEINGTVCGEISKGLLVFVGFEKLDEYLQVDSMINKLLSYRVFNDDNNKMNLSVKDVDGGLLIVSQFTIVADTSSGTRPGFSTAKSPTEAESLFDYFMVQIKKSYKNVSSGQFGADMRVSLTNDGPVTFMLSC